MKTIYENKIVILYQMITKTWLPTDKDKNIIDPLDPSVYANSTPYGMDGQCERFSDGYSLLISAGVFSKNIYKDEEKYIEKYTSPDYDKLPITAKRINAMHLFKPTMIMLSDDLAFSDELGEGVMEVPYQESIAKILLSLGIAISFIGREFNSMSHYDFMRVLCKIPEFNKIYKMLEI